VEPALAASKIVRELSTSFKQQLMIGLAQEPPPAFFELAPEANLRLKHVPEVTASQGKQQDKNQKTQADVLRPLVHSDTSARQLPLGLWFV
jgi:hypothetical protein